MQAEMTKRQQRFLGNPHKGRGFLLVQGQKEAEGIPMYRMRSMSRGSKLERSSLPGRIGGG